MSKTSEERINIRCTAREKKLLKELAKKKGVSISDLIKDKVFGRSLKIRITENGVREV